MPSLLEDVLFTRLTQSSFAVAVKVVGFLRPIEGWEECSSGFRRFVGAPGICSLRVNKTIISFLGNTAIQYIHSCGYGVHTLKAAFVSPKYVVLSRGKETVDREILS